MQVSSPRVPKETSKPWPWDPKVTTSLKFSPKPLKLNLFHSRFLKTGERLVVRKRTLKQPPLFSNKTSCSRPKNFGSNQTRSMETYQHPILCQIQQEWGQKTWAEWLAADFLELNPKQDQRATLAIAPNSEMRSPSSTKRWKAQWTKPWIALVQARPKIFIPITR